MPLPSLSRTSQLTVVMIVVLIVVSWFGVIDDISQAYLNESLIQASVAFAIARAINAIISVIQSLDLSVVFLSISPGEVLDPINDLVEQFSTLMKYAIGSLLIQQLLLQVVSDTIFKVAVTVLGVAIAVSVMLKNQTAFRYLYRPFVFVVFLRFLIVLSVLANGIVDRLFLSEEANENVAALEVYPARIESLDADSVLTPEMRAALKADLGKMQSTVPTLEEQLQQERATLEEQLAEVERIEQLRDARRQDIGMMQRLNPMLEDAELDEINQRLSDARAELSAQEEAIAKLTDEIEHYQTEIGVIEDTLAGKSGGILQTIMQSAKDVGGSLLSGGLISIFKDMMDKLIDTISQIVPIMLKLMAVFVLQTMVFPLLFLYAFVKGFKAIWNRDPRDLMKAGWADFRRHVET